MSGFLLLFALAALAQEAPVRRRSIVEADLPAGLARVLPGGAEFARLVATIGQRAEERVREGEFDHLVYFVLQSASFTDLPRVEPALSAGELVRGMDEAVRRRYLGNEPFAATVVTIPPTAGARIAAFARLVATRRRPKDDQRLGYFLWLAGDAGGRPEDRLRAEYLRAMRFLYRKEFTARDATAEEVARLYRERAHSTDTRLEANYAIYNGLAALPRDAGRRPIERVLIVGPGHDLAPRTGLVDAVPPQSFQPFAVADALLALRLSDPDRLRIDCFDINPRVVAHLREIAGRDLPLTAFSGIVQDSETALTTDFEEYFRRFGLMIGKERKGGYHLPGRLAKQLTIDRSIVRLIRAERLNIVTERNEPSPRYDLVVATNILTYFRMEDELPLALANISAMMASGGVLLHNDLPLLGSDSFTLNGLPVEQARTLLIAANPTAPFYDGVAIHRKR